MKWERIFVKGKTEFLILDPFAASSDPYSKVKAK
jgi:hypothetical protein